MEAFYASGAGHNDAGVATLLKLISVVDDTNIIHREGIDMLRKVQEETKRAFLLMVFFRKKIMVNDILRFYALSPITTPGTLGFFAAWLPQMQALQTALGRMYSAKGVSSPTWIVPTRNYPRADIINQIRDAIAT